MADTKEVTATKPKVDEKIKEPSMYNVIYLNDEVTTVEFVISTLIAVFQYDHNKATELTHKIHELGSAVVATYPYEIAEQKGVEVTLLARNHNFPLQVKLEAE
jgi:ATP-dependent Clp protease adaptor protein ClpS